MSFFAELKRRNVFRVGIAYVVVAWLVLQVADVVLNNIEAPPWVFQVILLVLAIGLPVVLVFAWAFEMTPEGLKREREVDRTESITGQTRRKLDRLIIGAMAMVIAFLLLDRFILDQRGEPSGGPPQTLAESHPRGDADSAPPGTGTPGNAGEIGELSIAVLPFVNMSPDQDNEYFSDGISEELLNVLVKVNALHVASRTSAFAYKGKELPVSQIARELDVDHVVEGSVRKAGNRVRITAQLIDGHSDRHLWSETYERELDDIFEIQEEISNAIVDALKIALDVDEAQAVSRAQRPTNDPEAFELYLRGRHLWRMRGEDNIRAGIALFRQAVEHDPDFAAAWESLAAATGSLSSWSNVTGTQALDEAIDYAHKALELDPKRAEARAIVAEYHGQHGQWAEMMDEYRRVVADAPDNGLLHQWRAEILRNLGYTGAALEEALTAYRLDPALPVVSNVLVNISIKAGRADLAFRHWKIASELGLQESASNNLAPLLFMRGDLQPLIDAHGWKGDEIPLCVRAVGDPNRLPELAAAMAELDLSSNEERAAILGPARSVYVMCYTLVGDDEGAMDLLESGVANFSWYVIADLWQPDVGTQRLRRHPRFKRLMRDMGLVDYWREHGWPDLCRPESKNDFSCD